MRIPDREQIKHVREQYPAGTWVELLFMNDEQAPPAGTCGTVVGVDDAGTVHTRWDNGSGLGFIPGTDHVRKL